MAEFVAETIDSVRNQTFPDWECIIVDDGSTDDSAAVVASAVGDDSRFRLFRKENGGVASAKNFGVSKACGRYLMPLDPDDLVCPDFLGNAVGFLEAHPDYALYYGRAERFGCKTGFVKTSWKGYRNLLCKNTIFNTAVFRTGDFLGTGGYDTTLPSLEDWELYVRLLFRNGKVKYSRETSFLYRIRRISRSTSTRSQRHAIYRTVYRKNHGIYLRSFVLLPFRRFR